MGRKNGRKSYFAREQKKPKKSHKQKYPPSTPGWALPSTSGQPNQNRKGRSRARPIESIAHQVFGGTILRASDCPPGPE